jgi:hypothetical protein
MALNQPPKDTQEPVAVAGDPFGDRKEAAVKETPTPREVAALHARSDLDSSQQAQHHTLGIKHDQASPGDHKHDGKSSRKLLEGQTLTGTKSGGSALTNLIDMLEAALGFTDNTT